MIKYPKRLPMFITLKLKSTKIQQVILFVMGVRGDRRIKFEW